MDRDVSPGPWGFSVDSYGARICTYDDDQRNSPLIVGDAPFAVKEDAELITVARTAFPVLVDHHYRKMRAHLIDTLGEEGMAQLLKN